MSEMLAAALGIVAEHGWRVLPLAVKGKTPILKEWQKRASADAQQVREWWGKWAAANVGIATGNGLLVLDVDVGEGKAGEASLAALEAEHGALPPTLTAVTGSGGYHLFFSYEGKLGNSAGKLGAGLDTRGDGGYVVAAPSVHPNGKRYCWIDGSVAVAPAPVWLVGLLVDKPSETNTIAAPMPIRGPVMLSDDEIIAIIRRSAQAAKFARLFDSGDVSGYASGSEADLALCAMLGFYTQDAEQIKAIVSKSALWAHDKWRREDYARLTIGKALSARGNRYAPIRPNVPRSPTTQQRPTTPTPEPQTPDSEPTPSEPPAVERPKAVAWSPSATPEPQTPDPKPTPKQKPVGQRYLIACTADDVGNAECVVRRYEGKFLYCTVYGWLAWNGRYWQRDGAEARLNEAVIETLKARRLMAVENDREAIVTAARGSAKHVRDCVYLLRGMLEEQISAFDADLDSVNVDNGVLCLRTGKVTPHDHSQRFTYCLTAGYDPNVSFAKWHEFIVAAVQGGHEVAQWLQLYFGYCLTGRTRYEVLLYLHGKARAGKGTVMQVLRTVMGKLAKEVDFATFIGSRDGDSNNFDLAGLRECRLVSAEETDEYERLNAAKIKQLTGGNDVRCSYKHKDMFEYKPMWKMTLVSNHPINADPDDSALWSRLRVVNFPNSMVGKEDVLLKEKLTTRDGQAAVLAWLVAGARRFYELSEAGQAMPYPAVLAAVTNHQRQVLDNVGQWLMECCVSVETAFCSSKALHSSYEKWCRENGVTPKQQRGLTLALQNKGFESDQRKVDGTPVRGVVGLGLKVV